MNRGCAAVVIGTAALDDVILRSVSLTRKRPSQTSLVAPGIVTTPDLRPPIPMDVELSRTGPPDYIIVW